EDYGNWLARDLLPRSKGDFRLGDAKFRQKLRYALESELTKAEILRRAEADLRATQAQMYEVALPLYRKYFPDEKNAAKLTDKKLVIKSVLNKLADTHPTNDTIVALAHDDLQATTDFVRTHNLVSLPTEPVNVIVMPEYARGVAVAYCDAAGPLERHGETYFDILTTPKGWKSVGVYTYLRQYNKSIGQDLTSYCAMHGS